MRNLNKLGVVAAVAAALLPVSSALAADSMFDFKDLNIFKMYHAYSASDGKSYVEEISIPSAPGMTAGKPTQTYFDLKPQQVRIGRGTSGAILDWHGAPLSRHIIMPLQGDIFFDLGDGRTLTLKPGQAILAEDWTGRGHRSGCAESKVNATCVGLDMLVDANPHAMPLRDPPKS
jgi:hypothetical protein